MSLGQTLHCNLSLSPWSALPRHQILCYQKRLLSSFLITEVYNTSRQFSFHESPCSHGYPNLADGTDAVAMTCSFCAFHGAINFEYPSCHAMPCSAYDAYRLKKRPFETICRRESSSGTSNEPYNKSQAGENANAGPS